MNWNQIIYWISDINFCATELVQIDVFFHLPAKFQHFQAFSHMSKKPCVMIKSGENVVVPVHGPERHMPTFRFSNISLWIFLNINESSDTSVYLNIKSRLIVFNLTVLFNTATACFLYGFTCYSVKYLTVLMPKITNTILINPYEYFKQFLCV